MLKTTSCAFLVIFGIFLSLPKFGVAQHSAHVPGELLVAPKAGVSDTELENQYKAHGGKKIKTLSQINVHQIQVPAHALEKIAATLANNPKVEFVEKNLIGSVDLFPNDPGYSAQWHLPKVSAPQGWDLATGSTSIVVAVIDSGVDPAHPDLLQVPGYNFLGNNTDTRDVLGHGTAVAGAAAALCGNSIGVCGTTWTNPIMPLVTVTSNNTGTISATSSAIIYAADQGARVINISLGWSGTSSTMQNAVNYAWNKGLVIVASAGNAGCDCAQIPAALNNVVTVSATDSFDNLASWSTFGNFVDVSAPGVSIYTTANGGGYRNGSGTSFSSPIVAGLAALIFSLNPSLTNAQVVELIKKNSDDLGGTGFDPYYGAGRINVARALQAAYSLPALSVAITSPDNGATVSGIVNVTVSANSTLGVGRVELYVNGALAGSTSVAPYAFNWNTSGLSGSHSLISKAYDVVGNVAASEPESVTISSATDTTPPIIQITSLAYDGKFLTVTASANDGESGIAKIELYIDNNLKATDSSAPWTFKLNSKPIGKGAHAIQLKAYDRAGNASLSGMTSVTF